MAKSLVIVESPTKARTMSRYLGRNYAVDSCMGHVRDLPNKDFGVDIDKGFTPKYVAIRGKGPVLTRLKKKAAAAEQVFLAPDPDREGEAIAWHLAQALNLPDQKLRRITFDEFTKTAIARALEHPGTLNLDLVNAQQARRILDRIVGYKISPLLWRNISRGLSAGRVQSVAVRIIVEREREIRAFEARPEADKEYWKVIARLHHPDHPDQPFDAELKTQDKKTLKTQDDARKVLDDLREKDFIIASLQVKDERKHALPPFSTDLLLRAASTVLGFSTKKTGVIAQQLYEGIDVGEEGPTGLITYMRTDSYHLSEAAVQDCRTFINEHYGAEYLPDRPNVYRAGKGAQEAHEAIRPTDVRRTPDAIRAALTEDQAKLYELIWKRFVACQMAPAHFLSTVAEVACGDHTFIARGRQTRFQGHLKVMSTSTPDDDVLLPELAVGLKLILDDLASSQHFEQPPPRYTEATLVAALKRLGIGRPSTYSAIVSTIQDRKYVRIAQRRFFATSLGEVVTDSLVKHFPNVLDVQFTSNMEEELDRIAEGKLDWQQVLTGFYTEFSKHLKEAETTMEKAVQESDHLCPKCNKPMIYRFSKGGRFLACSGYPDCKQTLPVDAEGNIVEREAPQETEHKCPECGSPLIQRTGKRGPFLACSAYPKCKTTFNMDADGNPVARPKPVQTDEVCPKCGKPMVIRSGRRGQFLACSGYPKCKTTKDLKEDDAKPAPRAKPVEVNETCPECGKPLVVRSGRRGDFLACSGYPKCKFTKDVEGTPDAPKAKKAPAAPKAAAAKTGVKCPEDGCGGELLERKGRFGIFYGCSNYPKCKFTAKTLPTE